MLCTEVLNVEVSWLDERNLIEESMYWEVSVNISNFRNSDLHEVREVDPVIILIILFFVGKFFYFLLELPRIWYRIPWQCENKRSKLF